MGISLPDFKLPNLPKIPSVNFPDVEFPKVNMSEIPDTGMGGKIQEAIGKVDFDSIDKMTIGDIGGKIGLDKLSDKFDTSVISKYLSTDSLKSVTGMDFNSMIPDMSSINPGASFDASMLNVDASQFTSGVDMSQYMGQMNLDGIDASQFDLDVSSLKSELDVDSMMNDLDMGDIQSQIDIKTLMAGEFGGSIPSIEEIKERANSITIGDIKEAGLNKIIESYKSVSGETEKLTLDSLKEMTRDKIQSTIDDKVNEVTGKVNTVKEVLSYVDTSSLDFSSIDAIRSNDYRGAAVSSIKGFVDGKFGSYGVSIKDGGIEVDPNAFLGNMGMDLSANDMTSIMSPNEFDMTTMTADVDTTGILAEFEGMDGMDDISIPEVSMEMPQINVNDYMPSLSLNKFNIPLKFL